MPNHHDPMPGEKPIEHMTDAEVEAERIRLEAEIAAAHGGGPGGGVAWRQGSGTPHPVGSTPQGAQGPGADVPPSGLGAAPHRSYGHAGQAPPSGLGAPTASVPYADGSALQRSPRRPLSKAIIATIAGAVVAVLMTAVIGVMVLRAPAPISDGARAAVEAYVAAIEHGDADAAAAIVPVGDATASERAAAALTARTSTLSDIELTGLAPLDRPRLAHGAAEDGDEVVRVNYTVAGERFAQDLRVRAGATADAPWTIRDPLTVEIALQPTVFGDVSIGDFAWTVTPDDAVQYQGIGAPQGISLEGQLLHLYPGEYVAEGHYAGYFDSAPVPFAAAPSSAGATSSAPSFGAAPGVLPTGADAGPRVLVVAMPSDTLAADLETEVRALIEGCFAVGTTGSAMPAFSDNGCDRVIGTSGLLMGTTEWTVTSQPTVSLIDGLSFDVAGGEALGVETVTLLGTTTTSELSTQIDFSGYYGVIDGRIVAWVAALF